MAAARWELRGVQAVAWRREVRSRAVKVGEERMRSSRQVGRRERRARGLREGMVRGGGEGVGGERRWVCGGGGL